MVPFISCKIQRDSRNQYRLNLVCLIPNILILLSLLGLFPTSALTTELFPNAEKKYIEVRGIGQADDCDKARDMAYRDAVAKAVGVFISSNTLIKNDKLIKDKIISYSQGYIKDLNIISQSHKNNKCHIAIKAKVKSTEIKDKLIELDMPVVEVEGKKLEAEVFTKQDKKTAGKKLLDQVVRRMPEELYRVEIVKHKLASEEEKDILRTEAFKDIYSWPKTHTCLLLTLRVSLNESYLNSLFQALEPLFKKHTDNIDGEATFGEPKAGFIGLTNQALVEGAMLEKGGYLPTNIAEWLKPILGVALGTNLGCDSGLRTKVLFLNQNDPVYVQDISISHFYLNFEKSKYEYAHDFYDELPGYLLRSKKTKELPGYHILLNSWLPYYASVPKRDRDTGCHFFVSVLAKGGYVKIVHPVSIPSERLSKINKIAVKPHFSSPQKEDWLEAFGNGIVDKD